MSGGNPGSDPHDAPRPVGALPSMGVYALIITLFGRIELKGALSPGVYVYVGSALRQGLLPRRVARHLAVKKKLRWHIDYLLAHPEAQVNAVVAAEAHSRAECSLVASLQAEGFSPAARGFGSSDCRCPSHLLRSPEADALHAARRVAQSLSKLGLEAKELLVKTPT
jgi:Uri superfamily endonuclease